MSARNTPPVQPCPVCRYKPTPARPAGENAAWLCSHVACPNRHPVTAAPGDKVPKVR